MTRRRRKQVIARAAEYLFIAPSHASCIAINKACNGSKHGPESDLERAYAHFYARSGQYKWDGLDYDTFDWSEIEAQRDHRLLLMAFFAEVGPEGLL